MRGERLLAVVVPCLVLLVGGCSANKVEGPSAAPMTQEDRAALKPQQSDDAILKAVKGAFAKDPALSREKIDVTVKDGRVTLTGTVSSTALKIRAEDLAREVPEVFGVDAERLMAR